LKVSVNGKYLSEALKVIQATETELNFVDEMKPIIMRGVDELAFGLVLPYRVQG
jgi:DNA polymerase III sliding clamp (beta) subunit (PCNA family)